MLRRIEISKLDDYFLDLGKRNPKGVYFYRINGYNQSIHAFIQRYYDMARLNGVVIEGKLPNPSNSHLAYYNEIMGAAFQMDKQFIQTSLQKWLPRMTHAQRANVSNAIYDTLLGMRQAGKNDSILKNAYIKFMCWFYYKLERIVHRLGEESLPKILYEGSISHYELLFMEVLSIAGCDIVLLQYQGDAEYLKVDAVSAKSSALSMAGMTAFPAAFSLKQLRQNRQQALNQETLYGVKPTAHPGTNIWLSGNLWEDIRKEIGLRGNEPNVYYNCFGRIRGVEDKLTYENELYQLQLELKAHKRNLLIVNEGIVPPTPDEINVIQRKHYPNIQQLIRGLAANIHYTAHQELQRLMHKAFVDVMLAESQQNGMNLNRLTNKAVYLLCWLQRYQSSLFAQWKMPEVGCFFLMGGCKNDNEALFCKFLARLPVDVLILNPNLNQQCCLEDALLYEVRYDASLSIQKYPEENVELGTVAYHAERELDTLMYQDTGLYRNQQYEKANAISLHTMYEEIPMLWDEELKYRQHFSIVEGVVNMPVVFAKICGVKDGAVSDYWKSIHKLMTPDTKIIQQIPHLTSTSPNPIKAYATEFYRNGRLQRKKIQQHKAYKYGILREPVQNFILDKLQLLLEQRIIKGTFENGTEYTIIAVVLHMETDILQMIQKFDFTKKNPKLLYVMTGSTLLSLEDSILVAFLNLIGFDILFFVPTGYQCVEKFFNRPIIEEHQIGEYLYDLQVPDWNTLVNNINLRLPSWETLANNVNLRPTLDGIKRIFKRGT